MSAAAASAIGIASSEPAGRSERATQAERGPRRADAVAERAVALQRIAEGRLGGDEVAEVPVGQADLLQEVGLVGGVGGDRPGPLPVGDRALVGAEGRRAVGRGAERDPGLAGDGRALGPVGAAS